MNLKRLSNYEKRGSYVTCSEEPPAAECGGVYGGKGGGLPDSYSEATPKDAECSGTGW